VAKEVYCLDTSVLVKLLVPEEGSSEATQLLRRITGRGCRVVAPAFSWTEVGTVLRKKLRAGLLSQLEAEEAWTHFMALSIDYVDDERVRQATWKICTRLALPTMYDAAFLAVCQTTMEDSQNHVEFWTADGELLASLGQPAPGYVNLLR
jgi:predicted nucleic acid-binding protein